jgi:hypothetical protein
VGVKGQRSERGVPELWESVKTARLCPKMTKRGKEALQRKAARHHLSVSEFLERLARLPDEAFDDLLKNT